MDLIVLALAKKYTDKMINNNSTDNPSTSVKSISSIDFISSSDGEITGIAGAIDTYGITYTDGTSDTFTVYNGKDGTDGVNGSDGADGTGIASIEQTTTSTANYGKNIVTVTLSDGTTQTFEIRNGRAGATPTIGTNGNWYIDGEDTGTSAAVETSSVSIKTGFKRMGGTTSVEPAGGLTNYTLGVFPVLDKYLCADQYNITLLNGVPQDTEEDDYKYLGSIGFTEGTQSFVPGKVAVITNWSLEQTYIYALSEGVVYVAIIDNYILEEEYPSLDEVIFARTSIQGVQDFVVISNKLYCYDSSSTVYIIPDFNDTPVNAIQLNPATPDGNLSGIQNFYTDGYYLYIESASDTYIGIVPISSETAIDLYKAYNEQGFTNNYSICHWKNCLFCYSDDIGGIGVMSNKMNDFTMMQESSEAMDAISGVFTPAFNLPIPAMDNENKPFIINADNYLLIWGNDGLYIYQSDPMRLVALSHEAKPESIINMFETDNYLYIVTTNGTKKIAFTKEYKRMQSVLN